MPGAHRLPERRRTAWRAAAALSMAAVVLAACSPPYDWRTVTDNVDGYAIDFPAKPSEDERQIEIAGQALHMHMRIAQAPAGVFAVGVVNLPSDDRDMQRAVVDYLRAGLARNVGAAGEARLVEVPLASGGQAPALELIASGAAGPKREHRTVHAWLIAHGARVYQVAIVGKAQPAPEQSEQFFGSFKLF